MDGLPRRDLWLLPLLSLLTVVSMLAGAEVLARVGWPEQISNSCKATDNALGFRYLPHCSSTMKSAEGPWYTNTYNECGYRSPTPCGPVPMGTRRIALIGASLSEGYLVEYPNTIGARLAGDLTTMCRRPVEVQNLAAQGYTGQRVVLRMDEALTLRPDAVLFTLTPYDIESQLDDATQPITGLAPKIKAQAAPVTQPPTAQWLQGGALDGSEASLQRRIVLWLSDSRFSTVARHFLFRNLAVYLPLYLRYGDKADFLRPPLSAPWRERLRRFDLLLGELADRAHRANVPLTLAFVPQQAELALMDGRSPPSGVDPKALPTALAAIAAHQGVAFVDTSQALQAEAAHPELIYYTVDGHPSGLGQPIIARYLAERYSDDAIGPFSECRSIDSSGQPATP
jgi:hypothetical protein